MESQIRLFRSEDVECINGDSGSLGSGSYGVVRLGFHPVHGVVALKCSVMTGGVKKKNQLERKIKHEIGLIQQAHHKNIVIVYGWTQWPGAIAIVMEYLPGGSLIEALEDFDVTIEPLLCLRMCYEISNGIAFIHNLFPGKRLVHGDIKPENILLTEDLHCKLADFGGARLFSFTGGSTLSSTRQHTNQFTEIYASPEILENPSKKLQPSDDTYSFSVTMYVVIGREVPALSNAQMKMYLGKVKQGHRLDIDVINEVIHELEDDERTNDVEIISTLKKLMEKCWCKSPSDRPLMLDVKNELYELLAKQDSAKIQQLAVDAAKQMEIEKVSIIQHKCAPIHQFLPPDFIYFKESPNVSLSTFPNDQKLTLVSADDSGITEISKSTDRPSTSAQHTSGTDSCTSDPDNTSKLDSTSLKSENNPHFHKSTNISSAERPSTSAQQIVGTGSCISNAGRSVVSNTESLNGTRNVFQSKNIEAESTERPSTSRQSVDETDNYASDPGISPEKDVHESIKPIPKVSKSSKATKLTRIRTIFGFGKNKHSTSNEDCQKKVNQKIETVKQILENGEIKEAATQSKNLISLSNKIRFDDCDVIAGNVIEIASTFNEQNRSLISLSLIKWMMPMLDEIKSSDVKLKKIGGCRKIVRNITDAMNDSGKETDIKEKCIPLYQQLLEQLKLLEPDQIEIKVEEEAWCMNYIGSAYDDIDDYKQADVMYRRAIDHMMSEVGDDYNKYDVVAACFYNCGLANKYMKKYGEAEKLFKQSIEIRKSVVDESEEAVKEWTDKAKNQLKTIRSKMSK